MGEVLWSPVPRNLQCFGAYTALSSLVSKNLLPTRTQGPNNRLSETCISVFECLLQRHGSAVACTGPGALAAADLEGAAREPDLEPPSRQPTSWRTILPKKFSHCYGSSRAHNRFPDLGIWQRNWDPSGNLTLEASGIWLQNFHRTGETDSWRAQTKLCVHQDPGERSSDPTRDWVKLVCECPGVSGRAVGRQWPAVGSGALDTLVLVQVLWKKIAIIAITPTIVWPQEKL